MRLLCASANSSPRWVRLEEGVIRVADGRGIGDFPHTGSFKNTRLRHVRPRTCHWNSYPPLEGGSFPGHPNARPAYLLPGDRGHRKPRVAVKQAFAHHEDEVALPQNLIGAFGNVN